MARRRRLPVFLRANEAEALLATAQAEIAGAKSPAKVHQAKRNWLIVMIGLYLGLRVSEICKLKVEDFDLPQKMCFVFAGKGDRDRFVPISDKLLGPLKEWIGDRQNGLLILSPSRKKLSSRAVQVMIRRLAAKAGIPRHVTPHKMRHTFATVLLERGATIREVQELLGHSSVATTEIYTSVTPERLRGAVDRL